MVRLLGVTVVLMLAIVANSAVADNTIKVGVILPLSGDAAGVGEAVRNGMTMAYEEIAQGDITPFELVYENDALDPKQTISAFNRLRAKEDIDVVVNVSSSTSKALSPLAEQAKIPMLAMATDPAVVIGRKYVVNFWVTPEVEIKALLTEIRRRGYKRIARVSSIHDFSISLSAEMDRQNSGLVEIASDEQFNTDIRDFRSYITRLRQQTEIDAIFLNLMVGQLGVFAKQARELGIKPPFFGVEIMEEKAERDLAGKALVGAWYINGADPHATFMNRYLERFPKASVFGASNGYDLVKLLAKAVETARTRDEINHFIHTVKDFSGVLGTFSADGTNRFTLPAAVKIVTETGFVQQ